MAASGVIYGIPFQSATVLRIDPTDDSITTFGSLGSGDGKWVGGVVAASGIIYGIPLSVFKPLSENNKYVKNYLITSFASNIKDTSLVEPRGNISSYIKKETNNDLFNLQNAKFTKKPITCILKRQ